MLRELSSTAMQSTCTVAAHHYHPELTLGTVRSVRNCILVSIGTTTLPSLTTVDSYLMIL